MSYKILITTSDRRINEVVVGGNNYSIDDGGNLHIVDEALNDPEKKIASFPRGWLAISKAE